MKKCTLPLLFAMTMLMAACSNNTTSDSNAATVAEAPKGQSDVKDDVSQKNIVQVAISSKDHSTLVKAVQAADLVNALSNAGPFTVFAPTNAAFDKLPAGTLDGLLKPDKKDDLVDILQYHVSVGVFNEEQLHDGQMVISVP